MSQSWSTAARKRFQKLSFKPIYSPLIGYTRINGIAENYLRVKRLLPDLLGGVDLDYFKFAEIYLKELLYLDTDIATAINNWENFLAFVKKMPPPERQRLLSKTRRFIWLAPIIYLSRRLRLHQLWRALYGWLIDWRRKQDPAPVAAKIRDKKEFEISVAKYGVNSIDSLADELRPILLKEAGLDLYCF